jgi:hypothetical protein
MVAIKGLEKASEDNVTELQRLNKGKKIFIRKLFSFGV